MGEMFVQRQFVEGSWPEKDEYYAFTALVAETIAVYYWCEAFCDNTRGQRRAFCIIGQRGLSDYAARATSKVVAHIMAQATSVHETWGWKFGSVCALRDALRSRRELECKTPEYMEQCNVSTYRAKRGIQGNYKVGVKDTPVDFDLAGFTRGRQTVWTLTTFKTPIQVLDEYAREQKRT